MRLSVRHVEVHEVAAHDHDSFERGVLRVDLDELAARLLTPAFESLQIKVATPGESLRITQVLDVCSPYAKVDGSADFPGILSPVRLAGYGTAVTLDQCVVAVSTGEPEPASEVIDMTGPGAEVGAFGSCHVVAILTTRSPTTPHASYLRACKVAMLTASRHLAALAAEAPADHVERYPPAVDIEGPRVAYVMQVHSHQRPPDVDEPILYGHNTEGMLPILMAPTEVLDGALIGSYWSKNLETYHIQRHPVVNALWGPHADGLNFTTVIATAAQGDAAMRERSVAITIGYLRDHVGAQGVILTKVGGGAPVADLMMTAEQCEAEGIKTVVLVLEAMWGQKAGETVAMLSPEAKALVSAGGHDLFVDLPPVTEVYGPPRVYTRAEREDAAAWPSGGTDATSAQRVRLAELAGATSQLGANRLQGVTV